MGFPVMVSGSVKSGAIMPTVASTSDSVLTWQMCCEKRRVWVGVGDFVWNCLLWGTSALRHCIVERFENQLICT